MKKHFVQKMEAELALVHLMKVNWDCNKMGNEYASECLKYRKYLHYLNNYLFRKYIEEKNPEMASQLPAVKPVFLIGGRIIGLFNVVQKFNSISKCFWKNCENELENVKLKDEKMELINEEEIKEEKDEGNTQRKGERKKTKKFNGPTKIEKLQNEFQQKMGKMFQNVKEKAKEEKAKLEKAMVKDENYKKGEAENMEKEYEHKFGTFNSSPFV